MKHVLVAIAVMGIAACTSLPATPPARASVVDVMVLGTYHMGNPGADLANAKADNVLTAPRQQELAALADQLAVFRPTAIMVESQSPRADFLDLGYPEFTPEQLANDPNETIQIAYRLANRLGISRVYGIDAQNGEIDFFPFERIKSFVEQNGPAGLLDDLMAPLNEMVSEFEKAQESRTVSQLLAIQNDPETIGTIHRNFYYSLLKLATAADPAGAALNYGWYARNAIIFSKLDAVSQPGDRVIVLFGSGHAYWLRHFAEETPGFRLVDPLPYLDTQAPASDFTANGS
jgi:hypothetical protein